MRTFATKLLMVAAAMAALTGSAHGQSGYTIVMNGGSTLARERVLQASTGLTCTDDSTNHRTVCVLNQAVAPTWTAKHIFPAAGAAAPTIPAIRGGNTGTNGHAVPNVADDTFALLAATQALTNKTITAPVLSGTVTMTDGSANIGDVSHRLGALWAKASGTAVIVDTYGATTTFNAALGEHHQVTMTGDITSWNITNPIMGQVVSVQFIQDGAGNHAVSGANAAIKMAGGAPTITVTASKSDILTFRYDGTNWFEIARSQNL